MNGQTGSFPQHGKVNCCLCFSTAGETKSSGEWHFRNDPGHWGSSEPTILVLGFSKGATQADAYAYGEFEDVPFAGCRNRLKEILIVLGLLSQNDDIKRKFRQDESRFAFASLLRCSLSVRNEKTHAFSTSGSVILRAFRQPEPRRMLTQCSGQFLRCLPKQLKLVVLLGVQDGYIKQCQKLISSLDVSDFRIVNAVAYLRGGVTWVHVTHPSTANGHFSEWMSGDPRTLLIARKRELAIDTIKGIPDL